MAAAAMNKVAISTKFGLFRFRRMSFGPANALAIFQRLMDSVLKGLLWIFSLVYLYDVIIYSRTLGGRLVYLIEVFSRLRKSGMKLKSKKCTFLASEVEYMGFKLTLINIEQQSCIVDAVRDFPIRTLLTDVKFFLGLAGFYRKFIRGFACIASPLQKLTKKDSTFCWLS